MNIREDFSEVEHQLKRIILYAQQSHEYNVTDWPHQKHEEDFKRVYRMDAERKHIYETLYSDGRDCAIWMSSGLLYFQQIGDFPTLKSYIEYLEKSWVFQTEKLEEFYKSTTELDDEHARPWAVNRMLNLFKRQIEMLKGIQSLVFEMKESDTFKKESGIKIEKKKEESADDRLDHPGWRLAVVVVLITAIMIAFIFLPTIKATTLSVIFIILLPLMLAAFSQERMNSKMLVEMYKSGLKGIPSITKLFKKTET